MTGERNAGGALGCDRNSYLALNCSTELQTLRPLPPNTAPIHETTTVCQAKSIHRMTAVTKMVLNSLAQKRPDHPASPLPSRQVPTITSPSFLRRLRTSIRSEGFLTLKNHACHWTQKILNKPRLFAQLPATTTPLSDIGQDPINMLSDDTLLEIFDFYVHETQGTNRWMTLVHVCQRWRNIIFGSPRGRGLNLQLVCTEKTPARRMLNAWPPLPIVIEQSYGPTRDMDNILAALEPNDRIYKITLWYVPSAQWEKVLPSMQVQFPALTHLDLISSGTQVVTNQIRGGSAPRLRVLTLYGISFRGLPKLLLSTIDLVVLDLERIPHFGYISPETMVTCLSMLTSLKMLRLEFESP
jgi:hypothetical protein